MTEREVEQTRVGYRRVRKKRKRRNRKRERLVADLRWVIGGLALGLPILAILFWLTTIY